MSRLDEVILRGNRASQPAASTANSGFLYCVTDESNIIERSNGSAWQSYSPSAGGAVATDAIWDAKGDLAVGTGANTAQKLTVGANGTVLTADSGQTTGLKYAAPTLGDLLDYQVVRKTSAETVTSSTTLQNDDALLFAIGASEVWIARFVLFCTTVTDSATPDIKVALDVPSGATGNMAGFGPALGLASGAFEGDIWFAGRLNAFSTAISFGLTNSGFAQLITIEAVIVNSTNAGNVTLQWAQSTSNGTGTIVNANSYLMAKRIA